VLEDEIKFLRRREATLAPGEFVEHLRTKGFSEPQFLNHWAGLTAVMNRYQVGPRALDLGVGPGWSSIFLAARGASVVACDISPDMIAIAKENSARFGLDIDFRVGDMRDPVTGGPFDLVLIVDALHHCDDEATAFASIFEVLRPGGLFIFCEPGWFHAMSPNSRFDRRHYGTTERSMWFPVSRARLRRAGFIDVERHYVCFATAGRRPLSRVKALSAVALTLTVGYPRRPLLVSAIKPLPAEAAPADGR
jgi:SAM-dependent methyltransferase